MTKLAQHYAQKTRFNFKPGLTVGLVSIPLSISLALASGATPVIGILSALWGGIVAALFAGSAYNIIGPTGALSGLVLSFILSQGTAAVPSLTITAGILILIAWMFNFQKYLIYIPGAVIHGFTLGVAFIIGLGQLNNALDLKPLHTHEQLILNIFESLKIITHTQPVSAVIFGLGLLFLIMIKKYRPQLPGAIVLTIIGLGLGYASQAQWLPIFIPTLFSKYGPLTLHLFPTQLPTFVFNQMMLQSASVIAFIAIIETMLSAKVANLMTKTRFNERREMLALSLANITSGLIGGIPVTAALARTSLNIKTGANSRLSALISALTIGVISLLFFSAFQFLPLPIVAAILVNVALNMVEHEHFSFLFHHDRISFGISLLVGVITFAADPIIAVTVGSTVMLLRQIRRMSRGEYEILVNKNKKLTNRIVGDNLHQLESDSDPMVYSFNTDLTYLNREAHILRLEQLAPKAKNLILRFRSVSYIDPDGVLMLEEVVELLERHKVVVYFVGLSDNLEHTFETTPFFSRFLENQRVLEKTADALEAIYHKRR